MQGENRIEVTFVKDPDFRRVRCSGFWGALTTHDEVQFTIYDDSFQLPEKTKISLSGDITSPSQEEAVDSDLGVLKITRHCHAEVTIPISAVPGIIKWLQERFDQYEDAKKALSGIPFLKEN